MIQRTIDQPDRALKGGWPHKYFYWYGETQRKDDNWKVYYKRNFPIW